MIDLIKQKINNKIKLIKEEIFKIKKGKKKYGIEYFKNLTIYINKKKNNLNNLCYIEYFKENIKLVPNKKKYNNVIYNLIIQNKNLIVEKHKKQIIVKEKELSSLATQTVIKNYINKKKQELSAVINKFKQSLKNKQIQLLKRAEYITQINKIKQNFFNYLNDFC
ncbi:hypothetical protein [Candidatus Vidania fulgoroideorum]